MNRREFQCALASLLTTGGFAHTATAAGKPRRHRSLMNMQLPTSGGQQLWADVRCFHQWRIQRHALTGHCRLLDGENRRHAWGTLETCETELRAIRDHQQLPPMAATVVILLHGLFRVRRSMERVAEYLEAHTDWEVLNLSYPSTRGGVADHAATLKEVIDHLDGVTKIHFVAHSLGNLVIRHWMADCAENQTDEFKAPEIGRMVMLGPPNHQPSLAKALLPIDRHKIIAGDAGSDLNGSWRELCEHLATPKCEFGILAGGLGDGAGYNPLIPGDDDMIVGVQETKLAGAADFRVLPVIHATMADEPLVQRMTHTFLTEGYFESAEVRHPLG